MWRTHPVYMCVYTEIQYYLWILKLRDFPSATRQNAALVLSSYRMSLYPIVCLSFPLIHPMGKEIDSRSS